MGTWIKETKKAIYLMQGGYYISKISKYPSQSNPKEQVVNVTGMRAWFTRADAPGAMAVAPTGDDPPPLPPPPPPPPSSGRSTNAAGLRLIKTFEGLRLRAYQDAVGIWTIGYGTTSNIRPGMVITEAEAERLLKRDVERFERAVNSSIAVSLNDNQFSALVSFSYNVGAGALRNSTLRRVLNQGNYTAAANEFPRWNRAGGRVLAGLTRRRNAERALFLSQDYTQFL
ncbi:MAG: lysozyme [Cyanobacteria bacterium P01_H01_bin.119]